MPTLTQALQARGLSIKDNLSATTDPGPTNDASQGYTIGSSWMNTVSGRIFRARNVGTGIAVWTAVGLSEQSSPIVNNWYNTGRWGAKNVGTAGNNGKIIFYPVPIPQRIFISALGVEIATANAGNVQAAIYAHNPDTGRPTGLPLTSTESMSTAVASVVSAAVNSPLIEPGIVWFAINIDNAVATLTSFDGAGAQMQYLIGSATQGNVMASRKGLSQVFVSQAFGTWPDVTSASFTESDTDNNPIVQYKIGVYKEVLNASAVTRSSLTITAPLVTPVGITNAVAYATNPALDTNDSGNLRTCFRIACTLAQTMLSEFRVTIRSGTGVLTITHLGAGEYAGGATPATVDPIVELLFGGVSGFVAQSGAKTSDWRSSGTLEGMQAGDQLLITFRTGGPGEISLMYQATPTNSQSWYQTDDGDLYWNAQNPVGAGFTEATPIWGVVSIETRGVISSGFHLLAAPKTRSALSIGAPILTAQSGPITIPNSFTDSRFSTNTAGSTANIASGTYTNKTWDDAPLFNTPLNEFCTPPFAWIGNSSADILTLSKCRLRWREGVRIAANAGVLNIDQCYLETFGRDLTSLGAEKPDHADGIQSYAPGGNGTINLTNSCIRSYTDAEAAAAYPSVSHQLGSCGFFWADDYQGNVNFTNVIIYGGGRGVDIYADVGTTTVRFNNVYFVPSPQGWTEHKFDIEATTGTLVIAEWNNVYDATFDVNGNLLIGAPIPPPGGTVDPGFFTAQSGDFNISWDAVPGLANQDAVTGLSNGVDTAFSSFACAVRFFTAGVIEARNAGTYVTSSVSYTPGTKYTIRMVVRLSNHTYDVYVTPQGQAEILIGSNYAFRTEQASVTSLNHVGKRTTTGDIVISNVSAPTPLNLPPTVTNNTFNPSTTGSSWAPNAVIGTMTASNNPSGWSITAGNPSAHWAIANNGAVTVTTAGATALGGQTGSVTLTVRASNSFGPGPAGTCTINYAPESAVTIPLNYNDLRYQTNTQETTYRDYRDVLLASRTFQNKDWDSRPTMWLANPNPDSDVLGNQFLTMQFSTGMLVTANRCRGYWREGYRLRGSNGKLVLNECYTQIVCISHPVTGVDHGDGVQAECNNVTIEVNNSVFRCCDDATAAIQIQPAPSGGVTGSGSDGFRWADNSTGTIKFNNVVIRGDGRGVSIWADTGTTTIDWTNVYFIDENSSALRPDAGSGQPNARQHYRYAIGENGGNLVVANWTNVRLATIDSNGNIVPGALLPSP